MGKELNVSKEYFEQYKKDYVTLLEKLASRKKEFRYASSEEEKDKLHIQIKRLESKKEEMQKNINNMSVSEETNIDVINIGDTVTIKYVDDDELFDFKLVGSNGNYEDSEISIFSPLGSSVYGKEVGDQTSFEVRKGAVINIKILSKK